ncbi:polyamine aminopropyltransferase [Vibrio phage vB_VpS_PG28]|nr:polyamine aminopropyltransferase [Vibrio phage vB_VpS_PG28]
MNPLAAVLNFNRSVSLPIPQVSIPDFKTGTYGEWNVSVVDVPKGVHGYFTDGAGQAPSTYVLSKKREGSQRPTVWMSFTAMELESHAFHIERANGHVVIVGLGMGMILMNVLRKPEVTKVTVVELDPEIITLFKTVSGYENWEGLDKLEILNTDALQPDETVVAQVRGCDYLYADIWELVASEGALEDMKTICKWAEPKAASYWCCEIDIMLYCAKQGISYSMLESGEYDRVLLEMFSVGTGIPVDLNTLFGKGTEYPSYGKYIAAAGRCMLQALTGRK